MRRWVHAWALLLLLLLCAPAQAGRPRHDTGRSFGGSRGSIRARLRVLLWGDAVREIPRGRGRLQTRIAHATIKNWLGEYYRGVKAGEAARLPPAAPGQGQQRNELDAWQQQQQEEEQGSRGRYLTRDEMRRVPKPDFSRPPKRDPCASTCTFGPDAPKPRRRKNLIIAPVGDKFNGSRWMSHPDYANYDLVLIHYGKNRAFACSECKKVFHTPGTKWKLLYSLFTMNEWRTLSAGYRAVMMADDDLTMDTCTLNRVFDLFHEYDLLMAQPSLCRHPNVSTIWNILYQQPQYTLRYTTFVEIMAPIFRMDVFQGMVGPTMYNAYTGWALDFVWPKLLNYPNRSIAVVDDVCMCHPPSAIKTGPTLYQADAPYSAHEEQWRREQEYKHFLDGWKLKKPSYPPNPVLVIGGVLRPGEAGPGLGLLRRLGSWEAAGTRHSTALLWPSALFTAATLLLWRWQRSRRKALRG